MQGRALGPGAPAKVGGRGFSFSLLPRSRGTRDSHSNPLWLSEPVSPAVQDLRLAPWKLFLPRGCTHGCLVGPWELGFHELGSRRRSEQAETGLTGSPTPPPTGSPQQTSVPEIAPLGLPPTAPIASSTPSAPSAESCSPRTQERRWGTPAPQPPTCCGRAWGRCRAQAVDSCVSKLALTSPGEVAGALFRDPRGQHRDHAIQCPEDVGGSASCQTLRVQGYFSGLDGDSSLHPAEATPGSLGDSLSRPRLPSLGCPGLGHSWNLLG